MSEILISSNLILSGQASQDVPGGGTITLDNPLIGYATVFSEGTVTPLTEASGLEAFNLLSPETYTRWEGTSTDFDETITFVANSDPVEVDYVGIARHNFFTAQIAVSLEVENIDSFTKVLLHFDGANADTTITDEIPLRSWTAAGNAQLDTSERRFGASSLLCDGTGDYVTIADTADFNIGLNDFTVDFWFNTDLATGLTGHICGQTDASLTDTATSFYITRNSSDQIEATVCYDGANTGTVGSSSVFTDVDNPGWHHAEITRSGPFFLIYIDGVLEGVSFIFGDAINNSSNNLSVGRAGEFASNTFSGWIDEFRLSIGVARHPSFDDFDLYDGPPGWDVVIDPFIPPDDGPIVMRFLPDTESFETGSLSKLRVRLQSGSEVPTASVLYMGKALLLQRRIYVNHTPMTMGRKTKVSNGRSENGNFLGRVILSESVSTKVDLDNLLPDWYRTYMEPFVIAAKETPFFFAWRPSSYPYEVGYGWMANDVVPVNSRANGMMKVSFEISGVV
jgi:Concanavalin A-like lectin/glucanases superfamily